MKHLYLYASLLVGGFLFSPGASAQGQSKIKQRVDAANGTPAFIEFDNNGAANRSDQATQVLKTYLDLSPEDVLKPKKEEQDQLGFTHQRYEQYYKGVRVAYGTYAVHSKNGVIQSINGEFKKVKGLSTKPALSEKSALDNALRYINADTYMWEVPEQEAWAKQLANDPNATFYPKGELVIVDNQKATAKEEHGKPVLAYRFNIYALKPLSRDYVYVNAQTGQIVLTDAIIKHAAASGTATTRYSGSKTIATDSYNGAYRLREYTRGSGIETYNCRTSTNYNTAVDFTDNNNSWTSTEFNNTAKDNAALDAHWAAEMTYDYFKNKHSRNSYDNAGSKIKSYVHYDLNYENAFWNGSVMSYGDGATRFDALTSLDVGAHEIGHAVCSSSADLVYSNESGAMNEGFSDIWGAAVEYYAAPEKSTWLIGEDIDKQQPSLRSMSNPNSQGQPDTYKGTNWYSGTADNGGVHTNSGVLNHWFYILSVGKSGTNDNGTSFSVSGLGIDVAAKIAYRAETVYLTSNSNYADARTYTIQAATDLYGAGSTQVVQTTNAWNAVGVGGKYGEVAYCTSKGSNYSYEWIAKVQLGSYTNTTGASGYGDYTASAINVSAGSSYALTLTPGFASTSYNEYWKIWIDSNNDGDFDDAGELVYDAGALSKTAVSGNITIPATASGNTRMRVSMKYNAAQTACETFSYGEVEDYAVNIGSSLVAAVSSSVVAADALGNDASEEVVVYPNPASSHVSISTPAQRATVKVLSVTGVELLRAEVQGGKQRLDISTLPTGVYLISIFDGQKETHQRIVKE